MTSDITLFRDPTTSDGATGTITTRRQVEGQKLVTFMTTLFEQGTENLVLVREDGEIQSLDGLDLNTKWISPASTISKNTALPDAQHRVEFAQLADAYTAKKRLLKGREDLFSVFPREIVANEFNPMLLILITSPVDLTLSSERTFHVVTPPRKTAATSSSKTRSVQTLLSICLPSLDCKAPNTSDAAKYNLDISSGILYELADQRLTALDLTQPQPKVQSQLYLEGAGSYLPLLSSSVLAASAESIDIYHPIFGSIQASLKLESHFQPLSRKRKSNDLENPTTPNPCRLVAYFPKTHMVHAIDGSDLIAFQINTSRDTLGRRRTLGLLLDSLGRGIDVSGNPSDGSTFRHALEEKMSRLDDYIVAQDVEGFERLMAQELGMKRDEGELRSWEEKQAAKTMANGFTDGVEKGQDLPAPESKPIPQWRWPKQKSEYRKVDPKWARYALNRIFSWSQTNQISGESTMKVEYRLHFDFIPHNVIHWLIETGHFNTASVQSALRHELRLSGANSIPPGQMVAALVDIDPQLEVLFCFLSSTNLEAGELVHAIRQLMRSLELFDDGSSLDQHLLTDEHAPELTNGNVEAEIEYEQDKADSDLQLAEYYLGDLSNLRGRALSLALTKLYSRPEPEIVSALQSTLTSAETVSLIYLLRFELARGGWTSRYLDTYRIKEGEDDVGHENSILLLSGLLNCCVDAIGAGGWLSGDAVLVNGDRFQSEELIASLKLEVSAALEGIEEATYLKGLTAEMIRYGEAIQAMSPTSQKSGIHGNKNKRDTRPVVLAEEGTDAAILPYGLKAQQQVSRYRVGAGGEMQQRTARDIGRLKSMKVPEYSRERIVI